MCPVVKSCERSLNVVVASVTSTPYRMSCELVSCEPGMGAIYKDAKMK